MEKIVAENQTWINDIWEKIEKKLCETAHLSKNKIPYTTVNGIHDDKTDKITYWTNGFWPAIMWLMYAATNDERYRETAQISEEKLDKALFECANLHHDVGFMWHISAGANYKITGNQKSRDRNLMAASILASRYNVDGGFIRAWNNKGTDGWAIIDCMMNLPLLYWASEELSDPRFKQVAIHHADKTMQNHIRPDGSVIHIVEYDVNNGQVLGTPYSQGYDPNNSSWSRGQSWAIYGFVLSYIHTNEKKYLDVAKRVAHYFISAICNEDYIPKCDFRSPDTPEYLDTTAGAIAACGLIEIAKAVPDYEKKLYLKAALEILKNLESKHCDWSLDEQCILRNGTEKYGGNTHIPIVYGDYFFIEAMYKLKGFDTLLW